MRVLVAEDDAITRRLLETNLSSWGYQVTLVENGAEALKLLKSAEAPRVVILDWVMPEVDGLEVCRRLREKSSAKPLYIILLTSKGSRQDIVAGLKAGADDYLTKPFDPDELRARIEVGVRVLDLQSRLAERVRELEEALRQVKQLQGLLPICSYCKRVRDDQNYWQQVEAYISQHADVQFSHGICPDCLVLELQRLGQRKQPT